MKSNYKTIGQYIRLIDVRNIENKKNNLFGVSVSKVFIKSIANTVGTNFTTYRVVKKNQFTYIPDTSRRGDKIGVALLENEEEGLVSQAYTVFEISDTESLLPQYLMMWFRRPEFNRYARFISHGSVREIFSWEDMCDVKLPVPSIAHQKEIVKEYNVLVDRINLNNRLIQKLEETAQAIYKKWFVDFEFPDENGKPYKSNSGEMEFIKDLDKEIPKGWEYKSVFEVSNVQYGYPFESELFCSDESVSPIIRIRDILSNETETFTSEKVDEKYVIKDGDILIGMDGIFHMSLWSGGKAWQNQRIVRLRCDKDNITSALQLNYSICQPIKELECSIEGTTVAHLSDKDIKGLKILVADNCVQERISSILNTIANSKIQISKESILSKKLVNVLLSKIGG